jgi:hypothetical protein
VEVFTIGFTQGHVFDRVNCAALDDRPAQTSLALIAPVDLRWQIRLTEDFKIRTRALFRLGHVRYNLSVTDPVWERRLRSLPEGDHDLIDAGVGPNQKVLLTISLGEPFHGDCYKLVAGVIVI